MSHPFIFRIFAMPPKGKKKVFMHPATVTSHLVSQKDLTFVREENMDVYV